MSDATDAPPPSHRLRIVLAPLVLALLACTQIALVFAQGLSPWKGGGFGMFSTSDHGAFRIVRVVAVGPEGEEPVELGFEWDRRRRQVRDHPSEARLAALARDVARGEELGTPLRVEIWRLRFDADDLQPRRERWKAHTWVP